MSRTDELRAALWEAIDDLTARATTKAEVDAALDALLAHEDRILRLDTFLALCLGVAIGIAALAIVLWGGR